MQLKSLVRYPIDIRRARQLLASAEAGPSPSPTLTERPIVLDLRTTQLLFDCSRHLLAMAHHARLAGSTFSIRCSPRLLAGMVRKIHGRQLLADRHVRWISPRGPLPGDALVLCDYEPTHDGSLPRGSAIRMMIGCDIDRSIPVMPYPMHPATLVQAEQTDLIRLRRKFVRRGIFFAGNQKPKYGDTKIPRKFGVQSRLEIIQTLRTRLAARVTDSIHGVRSEKTIILADSRSESIAAADWLPTLASARFFVCCPGSSQPVCHNLVEAMSVGTIPLIEYGDRISPQLADGENAICFRGPDGLLQAIERMDRLSQHDLSRISNNAARFYDRHLCGTRFMAALRSGHLDLSSRRICMPFHERNLYPSRRQLAA